MPHAPPTPARPPRNAGRRLVAQWCLAGLTGIVLASVLAVSEPVPYLPRPLGVLVAILGGWVAMLLFVPWREARILSGQRADLADLTATVEAIARGERERPLSALVVDGDDEIAILSRRLHDMVVRANADRRESRMLQRTMVDTIRKETSRATSRLRRQATTDPLTGLGNRRTLEQRLEGLFADDRRGRHRNVAAMVIDVDLFKQVNDTLGHEVGDRCLSFLGTLLASTTREADTAVRLGGDEFVLLMPDQSLEEATHAARRLAALFAQMPWPHTAVARPTLSIGVATANRGDPNGYQDLLRRADVALYRSKAQGRNAIEVSGMQRRSA